MGFGSAIVVAVTAGAAITLLPALMGFAGHNIDRFGIPGLKPRVETGARDENGEYHGWARWSHHVARHPVRYLIGSLAIVLLLAVPFLSLRLGMPDNGNKPTSSTLRRSYDLVAEGFGPGSNGPLILSVELGGTDADDLPARAEPSTSPPPTASPPWLPRRSAPTARPRSSRSRPTTSPQDERDLRRSSTSSATTCSPESSTAPTPTSTSAARPPRSSTCPTRSPPGSRWFIGAVIVSVVPAADGRVPLDPRPAQGRGHERAVDRRRLRRDRRHLPVGLGRRPLRRARVAAHRRASCRC